jgi:cytochrome c
VYRLPDLPMVGTGGPGDLIDRQLESDRDRFNRIPLGSRPMGLAMASDHRTVFVANFMRNSVQVVDIVERKIMDEIRLGGPTHPESVERKGMALFYDATLSLDQWYSCHSCHQDGGSNSRPMDTMNDGSEMTYKTVLPLFNVAETAPWTWHGWQQSLSESVRNSVTSTMIGDAISDHDTDALLQYMKTIEAPRNPFRSPDGSLSDAAKRGEEVFRSDKAACVACHDGPLFTDGMIHDVGLGSDTDVYDGYNTPSLIGLHHKVRWLHSGRARTLERVVGDLHSPQKVNGSGELSPQETADLIEYLKSL